MSKDDKNKDTESRRILERIRRETEPGHGFGTPTGRARDHFAARDADREDWVELWGTRIGRALALVFALVLIAWLVSFLAR